VIGEAIERYGFVPVGQTRECEIHLYVITAERRIEHPAVAMLAGEAKRTSEASRRETEAAEKKTAARSRTRARGSRKKV
jgi:hypothetical protein